MVTPSSPCLLCKDKAGLNLRLSRTSTDVTEHYKVCLYRAGVLQHLVPPTPPNTGEAGQVVDEYGARFLYKCAVAGCERGTRKAKAVSYKEYVFHCYQSHGVMGRALQVARDRATSVEVREKFTELMAAVVWEEEEVVELPEPRVEELHTCLVCQGKEKDTGKENKDAKMLRLNICTTRNHYANCLYEQEEGRAFYERKYPQPEDLKPGDYVKMMCQNQACSKIKRFRGGFSHKTFSNHMALYHGGLESLIMMQSRQDLKDMLPKLVCSKMAEKCFVPDHYGQ